MSCHFFRHLTAKIHIRIPIFIILFASVFASAFEQAPKPLDLKPITGTVQLGNESQPSQFENYTISPFYTFYFNALSDVYGYGYNNSKLSLGKQISLKIPKGSEISYTVSTEKLLQTAEDLRIENFNPFANEFDSVTQLLILQKILANQNENPRQPYFYPVNIELPNGQKKEAKIDLDKLLDTKKIELTENDDQEISFASDNVGQFSTPTQPEADILDDCKKCAPTSNASPGNITETKKTSESINESTIAQKINSDFKIFSTSKQTTDLVKKVKSKVRTPKEYKKNYWIRRCYKYVKDALLNSKNTLKRLVGKHPRYAGEQLKSEGYINLLEFPAYKTLLTNPDLAPKGSVLVYEPYPKTLMTKEKIKGRTIWIPDYGHIEVKTEVSGKGGYASDYYSVNARTGKKLIQGNRKLIGIFIKNDAK